MAKTATKAASKAATKSRTSAKDKRQAKRKHTLATHLERNGAHAYAERVPIMRDELADNGGSATVKELFKALKTSPTGLFATERRVAAAYRFDQRQESPIFERSNGMITLRKRQRTAAGSKRQTANGKTSRKRTRAAS